MPVPRTEPTPEELTAFYAWTEIIDATRGARRCLEDHICPWCEQSTLTVTATDTGFFLTCPCL